LRKGWPPRWLDALAAVAGIVPSVPTVSPVQPTASAIFSSASCGFQASSGDVGKISINYRRGDDPGATPALLARPEQGFRPEHLFMDAGDLPKPF
jgi:hypothetical protein